MGLLLELVGGSAVWAAGQFGQVFLPPRWEALRKGGIHEVAVARWRRALSAAMPWPILPLSAAMSGDAWRFTVPFGLGLMVVFWLLLDQSVQWDEATVGSASRFGKSRRVAWSDVDAVLVSGARITVRGDDGHSIGVNAITMDGAGEFAAYLLARIADIGEESRRLLEVMAAPRPPSIEHRHPTA